VNLLLNNLYSILLLRESHSFFLRRCIAFLFLTRRLVLRSTSFLFFLFLGLFILLFYDFFEILTDFSLVTLVLILCTLLKLAVMPVERLEIVHMTDAQIISNQ